MRARTHTYTDTRPSNWGRRPHQKLTDYLALSYIYIWPPTTPDTYCAPTKGRRVTRSAYDLFLSITVTSFSCAQRARLRATCVLQKSIPAMLSETGIDHALKLSETSLNVDASRYWHRSQCVDAIRDWHHSHWHRPNFLMNLATLVVTSQNLDRAILSQVFSTISECLAGSPGWRVWSESRSQRTDHPLFLHPFRLPHLVLPLLHFLYLFRLLLQHYLPLTHLLPLLWSQLPSSSRFLGSTTSALHVFADPSA